ncbi:hypothetical protein CVT26_011334 [Gymnopilus dilepis]|uniref:Peptidoglycan binding-like domain-containing protein n=1 Tax=Gymnopilus dilepis TaxID=231916 RepID=A0A409WZS7_9AGAR|nr:hypothetical protein CVT26_011334 [Gymnopilus dilepis]
MAKALTSSLAAQCAVLLVAEEVVTTLESCRCTGVTLANFDLLLAKSEGHCAGTNGLDTVVGFGVTNAAIKKFQKGLKMQPIRMDLLGVVPAIHIISLSEPVIGVDRKEMRFWLYNANRSSQRAARGEDSHQWNPERRLKQNMKEKEVFVGFYFNLRAVPSFSCWMSLAFYFLFDSRLTSTGSPSGCIGCGFTSQLWN